MQLFHSRNEASRSKMTITSTGSIGKHPLVELTSPSRGVITSTKAKKSIN